MPPFEITRPADDVFFVRGPHVNWTVLTEGDALTLIDTGYPRDFDLVRHSLQAIAATTGATRLEAVLITHGHTDHIGNIARLVKHYDGHPRVLTSAAEVRHVRREFLEQVTLAQVVRNAWNPRVASWAVAAIRSGGLEDVAFDGVSAHSIGEALDVPGRPVAIVTGGHTAGHTIYRLDRHGIVITGDALVTGHHTTKREGLQLLHPMFHSDQASTEYAFERLLDEAVGTCFLPGHGAMARKG
ncbi:MBL fold metallo-hydrolase [Microbacterium sp. PMB16]|uniref:MBL fold metallo-hydrolase n=1 Tax=Microbacterium sp. PMB16 TaxID=3120157 RepID=UPI003F4B2CD7